MLTVVGRRAMLFPYHNAWCVNGVAGADMLMQGKPANWKLMDGKEMSTNNCCKFTAIFIVFPGFCLKKLQQLFVDIS